MSTRRRRETLSSNLAASRGESSLRSLRYSPLAIAGRPAREGRTRRKRFGSFHDEYFVVEQVNLALSFGKMVELKRVQQRVGYKVDGE